MLVVGGWHDSGNESRQKRSLSDMASTYQIGSLSPTDRTFTIIS